MDRYIEFALNHYLLSAGLLVVTYLLLQELFESIFNKFKSLSPLMAVAQMNSSDSVIIDVREAHEHVKSHIEDAINVPLGKLTERLPALNIPKNKPIIVVCQNGARAVTACKTLTKEGYETVFNMTGGMVSWEENKLPIKNESKS